MLKNYPATQLFLLALAVLVVLTFISPFIKVWNVSLFPILDSLTFVMKVICGFLFYFTMIDIIDGINLQRHKHIR